LRPEEVGLAVPFVALQALLTKYDPISDIILYQFKEVKDGCWGGGDAMPTLIYYIVQWGAPIAHQKTIGCKKNSAHQK
jgi:hypothetical protein